MRVPFSWYYNVFSNPFQRSVRAMSSWGRWSGHKLKNPTLLLVYMTLDWSLLLYGPYSQGHFSLNVNEFLRQISLGNKLPKDLTDKRCLCDGNFLCRLMCPTFMMTRLRIRAMHEVNTALLNILVDNSVIIHCKKRHFVPNRYIYAAPFK